jgi:hypothetical protein
MKKKISLLLTCLAFFSSLLIEAQEFKIGIWVNNQDFLYNKDEGPAEWLNPLNDIVRPVETLYLHNNLDYPTSRINAYKAAGVNFIWIQAPFSGCLNSVNTNIAIFERIKRNEIYCIGDIDRYLKLTKVDGDYHNSIGVIDFEQQGLDDNSNWESPRPNYKKIIESLETNEYVLGYILGGELGHGLNKNHNITDHWSTDPYEMHPSEMSSNIVNQAIKYTKENTDKQIALQVGYHKSAINDFTDDVQVIGKDLFEETIDVTENVEDVDPQDHFMEGSIIPDLTIEGSYYELDVTNNAIGSTGITTQCFRYPFQNNYHCGCTYDKVNNVWKAFNQEIYGFINDNNQCNASNFGDNRHYLSKFHNIDYLISKGTKVISEISTDYKLFNVTETDTLPGAFRSTNVYNNNWLWFQTYNSIIHGASGVLFYGSFSPWFEDHCGESWEMWINNDFPYSKLQEAVYAEYTDFYNDNGIYQSDNIDCNCLSDSGESKNHKNKYYIYRKAKELLHFNFEVVPDYQTLYKGSPKRFKYPESFPKKYNNVIVPLLAELGFLEKQKLLNNGKVLYSKTIEKDKFCIIPNASDYLRSNVEGGNIDSVLYNAVEDRIKKQYSIDFEDEFSNENYGLRYTLISNGDIENEEVILVVSNPLNLPLQDISLDFCNIPNETIKNSDSLQWLFVNSSNCSVLNGDLLNSDYKLIRDSSLASKWHSATFSDVSSLKIPFNDETSVNISIGPLDVNIYRFISKNSNENCGQKIKKRWTNFGSNKVGGHTLNVEDLIVTGDFYGTKSEELIIFGAFSLGPFVSMQNFNNTEWIQLFNNSGNGYINRTSKGWKINTSDIFISGNFTNVRANDELLCIQMLPEGFNNRYSALLDFDDYIADWKWIWSNEPHKNFLGPWEITANSEYYKIDNNGDGIDELLCLRYNKINNITDFMILKFEDYQWIKVFSGYLPNIGIDLLGKVIIGNFNSASKADEFLYIGKIGGIYASAMLSFESNIINIIYNFENCTLKSKWPIRNSDVFLNSKMINSMDYTDGLVAIQTGKSSLLAKLLTFDSQVWNISWSNNNNISNTTCANIEDWPLYLPDENYLSYLTPYIHSGESDELANILCIRGFLQCTTCAPRALSNQYLLYGSIKEMKSSPIENEENVLIELYPNPSNYSLTVTVSGVSNTCIESITLNNMQGQIIKQYKNVFDLGSSFSLDISGVPNGVYNLSLQLNNSVIGKKVIVNH